MKDFSLNQLVNNGHDPFAETPASCVPSEAAGYVRKDFERWVVTERGQSIERYNKYPNSYKLPEVNTMWVAWKASHSCYST